MACSQSRLHDGQHDLIKGIKLACAVNAGGLYRSPWGRKRPDTAMKREHGRCCNAGNDQRDEAVFQAHLGDQHEAQCRHLCGHGHDEQDQGKAAFLNFEVIGVDAVVISAEEK